VCDTKTKLITGRYRPVPGTGTGAGHSDPVDPVTRWDDLVHNTQHTAHITQASHFLDYLQLQAKELHGSPLGFHAPIPIEQLCAWIRTSLGSWLMGAG
jgi:hypothetical protein